MADIYSDRFLNNEYAAPMVRASSLPFRSECLQYGASYVFTEELVDKKVISSYCKPQPDGTVLFLTQKDDGRTVHFHPDQSSKTIAQIGTADGVLASKAALKLVEYVSEINVNMGCPKSFSISGGMGAALLSKPEIATDIVKTLRSTLPSDFPLTCKIRYIGDKDNDDVMLKRTSEFMKGLIDAGADAITVHMRTVPMRPREPAINNLFSELIQVLPAPYSHVPIIANGDFFSREQIDSFRTSVSESLRASDRGWCNSVMLARGAMWNPSIFSQDKVYSPETVLGGFLRTCIRYEEPRPAVKWLMGQMMEGFTDVHGVPIKVLRDKIHSCRTVDELKEIFLDQAIIEPTESVSDAKRMRVDHS